MSGRIKTSWRKLKDETEGVEELGKKKTNVPLCLIKNHNTKAYKLVGVNIHAFLSGH